MSFEDTFVYIHSGAAHAERCTSLAFDGNMVDEANSAIDLQALEAGAPDAILAPPTHYTDEDGLREQPLEGGMSYSAEEIEQLVLDNLPLAEYLAGRYRRKGIPLDDLVQVASVGLMKAATRFEPGRGNAFSTYATPTITGELKRHFRDNTRDGLAGVPRPAKENGQLIRETEDNFRAKYGYGPSIQQVAELAGMDPQHVRAYYETAWVDSLECSLDPDTSQPLCDLLPDQKAEGDTKKVLTNMLLGEIMTTLPERDQTILRLRFWDELVQREIASQTGVGQAHVSRVISRALSTLAARMSELGVTPVS